MDTDTESGIESKVTGGGVKKKTGFSYLLFCGADFTTQWMAQDDLNRNITDLQLICTLYS